jgi:hypothetical protein
MSRSKWYYDHAGQTGGPVSVSQLRDLAASGDLQPSDRVRKEDMDRWVKARAVKGLFNIADESLPPPVEPVEPESAFDFFGVGSRQSATEAAETFHPAFDFFAPPPQAPVEVELHPVAPPPIPKSNPPQIAKPVEAPIVPPPLPPVADDSGTFQVASSMTAPVETRDEELIPFADFQTDVPMAMPASAIGPAAPSVSAELTGPEVVGQNDGTIRRTDNVVELSVTGGWLAARSTSPDGAADETYLRLRSLTAATLRDWPGIGLTLTFYANSETVSIQCESNVPAARAFLQRVLDAAV